MAPNDHDDDHDEDDGDGNGGGTVSTLTAAALALTKKLSSMLAPKSTDSYHPFHIPLKYWDIYVDDFCGTFQGNKWQWRAVKRILLQALIKVFRPCDNDDISFRQEPASIKKLKKVTLVGQPARLF